MVLLNPPSVLTSLQLKAEEGLVSLVIWVRVEKALIFLAWVWNEGIILLVHLAKKLVSYRCSFGFCPVFSCKWASLSLFFFFFYIHMSSFGNSFFPPRHLHFKSLSCRSIFLFRRVPCWQAQGYNLLIISEGFLLHFHFEQVILRAGGEGLCRAAESQNSRLQVRLIWIWEYQKVLCVWMKDAWRHFRA